MNFWPSIKTFLAVLSEPLFICPKDHFEQLSLFGKNMFFNQFRTFSDKSSGKVVFVFFGHWAIKVFGLFFGNFLDHLPKPHFASP